MTWRRAAGVSFLWVAAWSVVPLYLTIKVCFGPRDGGGVYRVALVILVFFSFLSPFVLAPVVMVFHGENRRVCVATVLWCILLTGVCFGYITLIEGIDSNFRAYKLTSL